MFVSIGLLLAVAMLVQDAPKAAPPPAEQDDTVAGVTVETKKICRGTQSTGSRLRQKSVCKTAKEWAADREDQQVKIRERQQGGWAGIGQRNRMPEDRMGNPATSTPNGMSPGLMQPPPPRPR